jgi:hypothetical protein
MRVRAAQERGVRHARRRDIAGEDAAAGDEATRFAAGNG